MAAVVLAGGIEVATSGREVRWIALWVLVDVGGVLAGRKVLELELDFDILAGGGEGGGAGVLSGAGFEVYYERF